VVLGLTTAGLILLHSHARAASQNFTSGSLAGALVGATAAPAPERDGSLPGPYTEDPDSEFSPVTITFAAPSTDNPLVFNEDISREEGDLLIDGVTLEEVPEPATWLSITAGLGMLLGFQRLARKRRG